MIGYTHTLPQAGAIIGHLIGFNVDLEDYDLSKMPQVCYKKLQKAINWPDHATETQGGM